MITIPDLGEESACESNGTGSGHRMALARALSEVVLEKRYAIPYLARRCRAPESSIEAWLTGAKVPNSTDWYELGRVSRDFTTIALTSLRDAAREEAELEAELDDVVNISVFPITPNANHAEPIMESAGEGRTEKILDDVRRGSTVQAPLTLLEFRCKISGGRIVVLHLPVAFTREDVRRIHQFLLTQVDDAP